MTNSQVTARLTELKKPFVRTYIGIMILLRAMIRNQLEVLRARTRIREAAIQTDHADVILLHLPFSAMDLHNIWRTEYLVPTRQ